MAKVYLDANEESYRVGSNSDIIFGNSGTEVVTVTTGTSGTVFDQNVERIVLSGAIANYTYSQTGNVFNVYETVAGVKSLVASIPVQPDANGTQLTFSDGTVNAVLTGQVMKFGDTTLVNGASDTNLAPSPAAVDESLTSSGVPGTSGFTYTLTTGIDTFNGSTYNDTFIAEDTTATGLDTLNGGSGTDTLNFNDLAGGTDISTKGLTMTSIETINVRSAGAATINATTFADVTALNVTQGTTADVKAAATAAVTVTGLTGAATVAGGSTQTVTAKGGLTLSGAKGAIVATDTAQAGAVTIDGGTSVNLTTTSKVTSGAINIGATTAPTGAVTVVENLTAAAVATFTAGAITIKGGTTVSVTSNASEAVLATAGANGTVTQAAVTVTGTAATTSVTVKQTEAVTAKDTVIAVAPVTETASAVFTALGAGASLIVDGLTFTAGAAGTTAAQTAAAFANLDGEGFQGNSTLGEYTGASLGNWKSGPVTGTATVLFTSLDDGNVGDLVIVGATITTTQGVAEVEAAGTAGIANGTVTITDVNFATPATPGTITSVTLDAFAGATISSNALSTLSLANSDSVGVTVKNGTATTLGLTVDDMTASGLDIGAKYTTLNVTTAGADSELAVTGSAVTALTVAGTNDLDLSGSTLAALKTATISGAAGVIADFSQATVTDVNASATSGDNEITIDATKATYEGGSGSDEITLLSAAPTKAISLGAGDDSIMLASGTTAVTGAIAGGDGVDGVGMYAADAATASLTTTFATKVTGFEELGIKNSAGQTVDVAMLGNYTNIFNFENLGNLTIDKLASGGTLTVEEGNWWSTNTVNVTNATTGTADVLNYVMTDEQDIFNWGTGSYLTAAKVETINLAANDTTEDAVAGEMWHYLGLAAVDAKTITVTGNASLSLWNDVANTKITLVDASGMTGGLDYESESAVAVTVKGGASTNWLYANTTGTGIIADTLIGGASDDFFYANAGMNTLTGNGGNDTFVFNTASINSSAYATITDANAGDTIDFDSFLVGSFATAKISIGDTAVFQDYANYAINNTDTGDVTWFQYQGNTYVINNVSDASSFQNSTDVIVKLTGLVDLSTASVNISEGTLLLG